MSTREYHDTEITSFRVDGDIWARLVKFEGKEYIACLMNSPPPDPEDKASLVVKLRKPEGPVKALYVAFDYLGIRKLVIGVDDEPPSISPEEGLWWFTMVVNGDTFTCQSDGMKLRKMKPAAFSEFPHGTDAGLLLSHRTKFHTCFGSGRTTLRRSPASSSSNAIRHP
ncbi:hypothetical protein V2G26_019684 [Clonostachys chloroleuca]